MNQRAIELGMAALRRVTVPAHWRPSRRRRRRRATLMPDFIRDILQPMNRQRATAAGDAFAGMEDGTFPAPPLGEARHRVWRCRSGARRLHPV